MHGHELQFLSPQFKEFESAYECDGEAESSGDLLGLWKLAVPRGPQIYRVPGGPRGGHRIGSKNSGMFLLFRVGCAPLDWTTGKVCCVLLVSFRMHPDFFIFALFFTERK